MTRTKDHVDNNGVSNAPDTSQPPDKTLSERRLPVLRNVEIRKQTTGILPIASESEAKAFAPNEHSDAIEQLQPGDVLKDCYEIKALLGEGGMGTVYLVYNRVSQAERALKILHQDAIEDHNAIKRFENEVSTLASLRHPGLVRVYDAGAIGEHLFYTMEVLSEGTLHDLLAEDGPMSPHQALTILQSLAKAVGYIHAQGLIHRDLKSENIAFNDLGQPVVMDFGLVLRHGLSHELRLTKRGHIVGSVHYMAPEQAQRPYNLDHRCDIYALGVLFYEMLTGAPPFNELEGAQVLSNTIAGKTPSLALLRPDLSDDILLLCNRAMALRPDDRFATVDAMLAAIKQCQKQIAHDSAATSP